MPSFNCDPNVNTTGVVDFSDGWRNCTSIVNFPPKDLSSGVNFYRTWDGCSAMQSIATLNLYYQLADATEFVSTWEGCSSLTSFQPNLNLSSANLFDRTWKNCTSLTSFPFTVIESGTTFTGTWAGCNSLTSFPLLDFSSATVLGNGFGGGAWEGCTSLASFPAIDTSSATGFTRTWRNCSSLTSFPQIDTGSGLSFYETWYGCGGLTSFPTINTSNGVGFLRAWWGCNSLTSFPQLDFSNAYNLEETWGECYSLTSFPQITLKPPGSPGQPLNSLVRTWLNCESLTSFPLLNTSGITSFSGTWQNCYDLETFPPLDTSSATSLYRAWMRCSSLTSFPLIDTSSVGNLNDTWRECNSLTSFPLIDTSSCTTLGYTWLDCSGLTSFPLLNTSNVTTFDGAWRNNSSLTSFPLIDTSSGSVFGGQNNFQSLGFTGTWQGCTGLTSFPALNFDNGTIFEATWLNCTNLADFPPNLFDNCAATNFTVAWRECALTAESIENILVSIDAGGALNGILDISLGTNAAYGDWTAPAIVAFDNLEAKGWNILYNNLANRWLAYSTIDEGAVNSHNSAVGPGGEIYSFIANSTGSELSKFSIFGNLEWSKTISPPNTQYEWGPVAVSQTVHSLPDDKVLTVVDDNNGNHHFICLNSSGQTIYNQALDGSYEQNWELRALNNARTQMLVSELQQYQPHVCNLIDVTNGSFLKRFSFSRPDSLPVWRIIAADQKPNGNWVLAGILNGLPYDRFLVEVDETFTNVVQAVDLGGISIYAILFHPESGGYLLLEGSNGRIHLLDEFFQPIETRTFSGWATSMQPSTTGFYIWNSYVNFYSDLGMPGWPSLVNLIDYDWNLNEVSFFTQVNGISPYSAAASLDTVNQRVIITPSGIGLYGGGGGTAAYKYVSSLDFLQPLAAGGTPIFADNPPGYGLYARSEINPTTLPVIGPPTITATSVSMSIVPESNVPTIAPTLSFQNSAQTFDLVVSTVPGPPVPPPVASSSWFQSVDDWKYNADATQIWPGP